MTTKIHAAVDALGNLLCLLLGPGQQADCARAGDLLQAAVGAGYVLADKGDDTNQVLRLVTGAGVVIPSKRTRLVPRAIDCYRDLNKPEQSGAFFQPTQAVSPLGHALR